MPDPGEQAGGGMRGGGGGGSSSRGGADRGKGKSKGFGSEKGRRGGGFGPANRGGPDGGGKNPNAARGGGGGSDNRVQAIRRGTMRYDEAKELLKSRGITKDHWTTIQQWRIDQGKSYAKSRSSSIARMGASGMKVGSQQWEDNLGRIDAADAKERKSQAGSATQGILDRWTKTMKTLYVEASMQNTTDRGRSTATNAGRALKKYGKSQGNIFTKSGLSAAEFKNLSTEDFMQLSFGESKAAAKETASAGRLATSDAADKERQKMAKSQQQTASPWWG